MSMDYNPRRPEVMKQRFAEDIYDSLPVVETGVEIPRVSATRLASGKDAILNISSRERLGREGWDMDILKLAQKGNLIFNRSGEVYEILEINKGILRVKDRETGTESEIVAQPRNIKAKEYSYNLRNGSRHSRKIKVYDAAFKDDSLDTSGLIDSIVGSIPAQCMEVFDEIQIHPQNTDKAGNFKAEASLFSDRKVLTLYIDQDNLSMKDVIETTYHEIGHAIARYLKGTINPGEVWKHAMTADGNNVSEYSVRTKYPKLHDAGETEDFADSVMMYLATDGAKTTQTRTLRDFCNRRFQILDQIFQDLSARQNDSAVSKLAGRVLRQLSALDKKS